MTKIFSIALVGALLCGCSSAGKQAEEQYAIVERVGTKGELCDAARRVADAYLKSRDQEKYKAWRYTASIDCLSAQQSGADLPVHEDEDYKWAKQQAQKAADDAQREIMRSARDAKP